MSNSALNVLAKPVHHATASRNKGQNRMKPLKVNNFHRESVFAKNPAKPNKTEGIPTQTPPNLRKYPIASRFPLT